MEDKKMYINKIGFILFVFICFTANIQASLPALREQISLNGSWPMGGVVPVYSGDSFESNTYEREVSIPGAWKGKQVELEFNAVNFVAEIRINGKLVTTHIGGWMPFAIDLTGIVNAGETFVLNVLVKDYDQQPYLDENGKMLWPMGDELPFAGIVDDVWLRAYGDVAIKSTRIITSFREEKLLVDYTVRNNSQKIKTIQVQGEAIYPSTGGTEISVLSKAVTLKPGEEKIVRAETIWEDAKLWTPDSPNLYQLKSEVLEDGAILDGETRQFGFREIWIDGDIFRLNGVPLYMRSDHVNFGRAQHWDPDFFSKDGLPDVIRRLKNLNLNCIRFHKQNAPQWVFDLCDEMGFFLQAETPINGANNGDWYKGYNKDAYISNCKTHLESWIPAHYNHPSVVLWSAMNEMYSFSTEQMLEVGNFIDSIDGTRPVVYEDGKDVGSCRSVHYPRFEGAKWSDEPEWGEGSIYSWKAFVANDRPTTSAEVIYAPGHLSYGKMGNQGKRNVWWQGIWSRGMRATGWDYFGPSCVFTWVWQIGNEQDLRIENLRNAMAPVALFGKAYDELGIAPYVGDSAVLISNWPHLVAGETITRDLILFNQEFSGENITVEIEVRIGNNTFAVGEKNYSVPLGSHQNISCDFQVPYGIDGEELVVILRTKKGTRETYKETKRFVLDNPVHQNSFSSRKVILH